MAFGVDPGAANPVRRATTEALAILLLTAVLPSTVFSQGRSPVQPKRDELHRLNNEALRLYSEKRRRRAVSGEEAARLLARRRLALGDLIRQSPAAAAESALPPGIARKLAETFPASAAQVESYGAVAGVYEVEVEDGETGGVTRRAVRSGDRRLALFAEEFPAGLESGGRVEAAGMFLGDMLAAAALTPGAAALESEQAAMGAGCSTLGAQRIAVLKVRPQGVSANLANASIEDWLFGSSGITLNRFWQENSAGGAWAEGDVYPPGADAWFDLDREYSCTESSALRTAALNAANASVDFRNYDRVVIVFPRPSEGCTFAGLASIGCWVSNPDGGTSLSYALQVLNSMSSRTAAVQLSSHEGGHMLGLYHSSAVDYGAEALGDPSAPGSRFEYGDRYSTMGFWNSGHYAAAHKRLLGWIQNHDSIETSGTYRLQEASLAPNSTGGAVQALEIRRGSSGGKTLWAEFRRRLGDFWSSAVQSPGNGVMLRLDNATAQSLLIDFTPQSLSSAGSTYQPDFGDATLNVGQSWVDPYTDLRLSVASASDSGLDLEVTYGAPVCSQADPTVVISPPSQSVTYPAAATYQATVTNNDSASCNAATFTLGSSATLDGYATSQVATSLGVGAVTLAPAESALLTLTATPAVEPSQATSYGLTASVSRGGNAVAANAGLVIEPGAQLELSTSSLALAAVAGGAAPAIGSVGVTSSGPDELAFTARVLSGDPWLSVGPAGGSTPAALSVFVDASLVLSPATLSGTIEVESETGQVETFSVSATVAAPPAAVASWSLDAATPGQAVSLADGSAGGHDLTTVGRGSAPVSGVAGSARVFNGYRDYAWAAGSADFTPQRFTARAWVRLESLPRSFGVVLSAFGGANHQGWFLGIDSAGRPLLMAANPPSSAPWLTAAEALTPGRWYMLTATFDRTTNRGNLYIDSQLVRTAVFPGLTPDPSVSLTIGKASWTESYHLNAAIDAVEIVPYARSASAVAADFAGFAPPAPVADMTVGGRWTFDDGVADLTGNGHAASFVGVGPGPGAVNGGLRFDGVNDHARVSTSERLSTADFTLRAWVRLLAPPNGLSVMVSNSSDFTGWYLGVLGDRRPFLGIASKPASVSSTLAATPLPLEEWTALTVTYDGAQRRLSLYINGALASSNFVAGLTPRTAGELTLGRASWVDAHYTHMDLDELLFVPEAWNAAEAAADYASFTAPAAHKPAAYWRFDEGASGAGSQLADETGAHPVAIVGSTDSAAAGQVAGAHRFGGWPGYGSVAADPGLASSSFSFSSWVRLDAPLTKWGVILSSYDGEFHGWYAAVNSDGRIVLCLAGEPGSTPWTLTSSALSPGVWHHVAVTFDGESRRGRIYFDGTVEMQATFPAWTPAVGDPLTIGRGSWADTAYLDVTLDETALFDYVLTPGEVQGLATP